MGIDSDEWKLYKKIVKKMEADGVTKYKGDGYYWTNTESIGQIIEFKDIKGVWKITDVVKGTVSSLSNGKVNDGAKIPQITIEKINEIGLVLHGKDIILSQHVDKKSHGLLKIGSICIGTSSRYHSDGGNLAKVVNLVTEKKLNHEATNDTKENPLGKKVYDEVVMVEYRPERYDYEGFLGETHFEGEDKKRYKDPQKCELDEFLGNFAVIEADSVAQFEANIAHIEKTGEIPAELQTENNDGEAGLVSLGSKDYLNTMELRAQRQRNTAAVIHAGMIRVIERHKREVEVIKQQMYDKMELLKKQIKKINRLITTLEIFLGISEDVIQISEGAPASDKTPIGLRQMKLFMDEEVGDTIDGGIDHHRIAQFDEWLVDNDNYKKLIPEEKGVVMMAPRRHAKNYGNRERNREEKEHNEWTYTLIRNGQNLYRIYSRKISYTLRLFPLRQDLQDLLTNMSEISMQQDKINRGEEVEEKVEDKWNEGHTYTRTVSQREIDEKKDNLTNELFHYQRNILLLQGIIFRTDIFAPVPEGLNLLDANTHEGRVQFIYDDEETLPTGIPAFIDWQKDINSRIIKGSRIVVASVGTNFKSERRDMDRYVIEFGKHNAPPGPPDGIHTVQEYVKDHEATKKIRVTKEEFEVMTAKHGRSSSYYDHKKNKFVDGPKKLDIICTHSKSGDVETYELDRNGNRIQEIETRRTLCIRYNPGDKVYGSWGNYDPHTRKVPLTYLIYPDADGFLLNYDLLDVKMIDYYLESRTDRHNYAQMLPVLRTLRTNLLAEIEWEKHFVSMLAGNLKSELSLPDVDIEPAIWDAIRWWKDEIVVWKRPITKNDAKALAMITQQVKRILRDKHGYKKLDTGVDNRKKVLVYQHDDRNVYFATGVTKKQFIDAIWDKARYSIKLDGGSRASIERAVTDTKREHIVKLATAEPDTLHMCTKAQYLGETPIKNK